MTLDSRRAHLRHRSAEAHAELDRLVGGFDTIDDYKRYLRAMAQFRLSVEADLRDQVWPQELRGWRPTMVGNALCRDLADLGVDAAAAARPQLPRDSYDALLGVGYVLEGSCLGAKLLHRRAVGLGLSAAFGAGHLALQSDADQNWRAFTTLLEQVDPLDMDKTSAAALATFRAAGKTLATAS